MKQIETNDYKLLFSEKSNVLPDIILETYRGKIYCNLLKIFIISCVSRLDEKIFTNKVIIISVIDNLLKGAAGQAVQNLNLMMGFNEAEGLNNVSMFP